MGIWAAAKLSTTYRVHKKTCLAVFSTTEKNTHWEIQKTTTTKKKNTQKRHTEKEKLTKKRVSSEEQTEHLKFHLNKTVKYSVRL